MIPVIFAALCVEERNDLAGMGVRKRLMVVRSSRRIVLTSVSRFDSMVVF